MYKKTIALSALMVFSCASGDPFDSFAKMRESVSQMHKEIDAMFDSMQVNAQTVQQNKQTVSSKTPSVSETDETVLVTMQLSGIDAEKIDIKKMPDTNGEYLSIMIPATNCTSEMIITSYEIAYSSKQEIKEEKTKDDTSKPTSIYYSYGSSSMRQSLPAKVSFDDVKAEYNNEILTITLQKIQTKKVGQVIPVVKK